MDRFHLRKGRVDLGQVVENITGNARRAPLSLCLGPQLSAEVSCHVPRFPRYNVAPSKWRADPKMPSLLGPMIHAPEAADYLKASETLEVSFMGVVRSATMIRDLSVALMQCGWYQTSSLSFRVNFYIANRTFARHPELTNSYPRYMQLTAIRAVAAFASTREFQACRGTSRTRGDAPTHRAHPNIKCRCRRCACRWPG